MFFLAMRAPLKLINVYSLFLGTRIHVFLYSVSMLSFKISQWFWAFFTDVHMQLQNLHSTDFKNYRTS